MKQLDQGEIAATARARLHGDMVSQRNELQVPRPQPPRQVPPAMNPAFTYPGETVSQLILPNYFRSWVEFLVLGCLVKRDLSEIIVGLPKMTKNSYHVKAAISNRGTFRLSCM